ncbi:MAG TPA: hypothetical protein VNA86_11570 [bacterium]|jgi:hypothetical protein|nr:hypothetical protein [bacterium]
MALRLFSRTDALHLYLEARYGASGWIRELTPDQRDLLFRYAPDSPGPGDPQALAEWVRAVHLDGMARVQRERAAFWLKSSGFGPEIWTKGYDPETLREKIEAALARDFGTMPSRPSAPPMKLDGFPRELQDRVERTSNPGRAAGEEIDSAKNSGVEAIPAATAPPGEADLAAVTPGPVTERAGQLAADEATIYHTGLPGKLTSWHLLDAECRRRYAEGERYQRKGVGVESPTMWASVLRDWLRNRHPHAPLPTVKTLTNRLPSLLRQLSEDRPI